MKTIQWGCLLLIMAACSSPRYTYFFDRPRMESHTEAKPFVKDHVSDTPQAPEEPYVATLMDEPMVSPSAPRWATRPPGVTAIQKKESVCSNNGVTGRMASGMDNDLKRGIVFSATGIAALIIGGSGILVVLGCLSLAIGLIFGIKWVLRQ